MAKCGKWLRQGCFLKIARAECAWPPLRSCVKLQHSIYQESDTPYYSQGPCPYFCYPLKSGHNGMVPFHVRAGLAAVSVTKSPAHCPVIPRSQQAGAGERGV